MQRLRQSRGTWGQRRLPKKQRRSEQAHPGLRKPSAQLNLPWSERIETHAL
jgi:hypothetical protein